MSKGNWLIRVEGVNLSDAFNTNDLSTIRGASLALESFGWELSDKFDWGLMTDGPSGPVNGIELLTWASSQIVLLKRDSQQAEAEALCGDIWDTLSGLYAHENLKPDFIQDLRQAVLTRQTRDIHRTIQVPSEHLTFVIDLVAAGDGKDKYAEALAQLSLKNARRQQRSPNLVRAPGLDLPEALAALQAAYRSAGQRDLKIETMQVAELRKRAMCPIDFDRPISLLPSTPKALAGTWVNQDAHPKAITLPKPDGAGPAGRMIAVSKRVSDLRAYGRDGRATLYSVRLTKENLQPCVADFVTLVDRGLFSTHQFAESFEDVVADGPDGLPSALYGKLAYLYVDGNSFSKLRGGIGLKEFSKLSDDVWASYTAKLLDFFLPNGDAVLTPKTTDRVHVRKHGKTVGFLRLETLFAGGDEFCVVMPAWLAWHLTGEILTWLEDAGRAGLAAQSHTDQSMTFRAGLVIAPQKSPARIGRDFAKYLCDNAKIIVDETSLTSFAFQIFESEDVAELGGDTDGDLAKARGSRYQHVWEGQTSPDDQIAAGNFKIPLANFSSKTSEMLELKRWIARSQLYRLIEELEAIGASNHPDRDASVAKLFKDHFNRSPFPLEQGELDHRLPGRSGGDASSLLARLKVFADLWDYLDPLEVWVE